MENVSPYKPGTTGAAMEACYNSCQTCKHAMDHRMGLQCCHPKRDKSEVCCVSNNIEGPQRMRYLQKASNYCVSTDEWCKHYSACDIDNSTTMYSTGGTSTGSVGSAAGGG